MYDSGLDNIMTLFGKRIQLSQDYCGAITTVINRELFNSDSNVLTDLLCI